MTPGDADTPALLLSEISCTRADASVAGVSLAVPAGRLTAFRGDAGCGKELLLKITGLLEPADSGELFVAGLATQRLDEGSRAELRRHHFGYLFASPFLLPAFTVIENVVMPMFKVLDSGPTEARTRAEELLVFAGVERLEQERAGDLSVTDQRRIALVRALCTGPSVLLVEDVDADTTPENQREFASLLREACTRWSLTAIATTSSGWVPSGSDLVFDVNAGKVSARAEELPRG
jgi:lipoprotein-releasing system ATP-binding protein